MPTPLCKQVFDEQAEDAPQLDVSNLTNLDLATIEKMVILQQLEACNGNRTHTAQTLGISIRTLRNKLADYRDNGEAILQPLPSCQEDFQEQAQDADKLDISSLIGSDWPAIEKAVFLQQLDACNGNRKYTGQILKISRKTVTNKIARYRKEGAGIPEPGDF